MPLRDIVGHRRLLRLLSRSIKSGTLPPSLMFAGPEGVGKRLAAQAIAQTLNCASPTTSDEYEIDACGACPSCRRIARGIHADVLALAPGENGSIKIEQVREAIERTIYRPFEGKRRVTLVDDADALMPAAQNALLKTLEEPPSSSLYILVTSRPDALLATVRSRCSQIRFARLGAADVRAVLERDHKYSKREAAAVAALADGSVRQALNAGAGEYSDARSAAGALLQEARARGDARARVERGRGLVKGGGGSAASEREYLGLRLQALASLVRDLGILSVGADTGLLANPDLRPDLERLSASFDSERALGVFTAVESAQTALDRNVSPKVVADWLALQL